MTTTRYGRCCGAKRSYEIDGRTFRSLASAERQARGREVTEHHFCAALGGKWATRQVPCMEIEAQRLVIVKCVSEFLARVGA